MFYWLIYCRYIGYRPVPIQFCISKVGWVKNRENVEKIAEILENIYISVKYRTYKSRAIGLEIQQKISKKFGKKLQFIADIVNLSVVFCLFLKKIGRVLTYLTYDLKAQIHSCFDPTV